MEKKRKELSKPWYLLDIIGHTAIIVMKFTEQEG